MHKDSGRKYNMDVLRTLLILMVIVLHYNNRGMGGALNYAAVGGAKEAVLRFTESACICAVDGFLMFSGYFSGNRSKNVYKKGVWLLAACSFYRTVAYILHALLVIHEFSFRTLISYVIPSNWFVCLFVTVLVLAPFIDRMFKLMSNELLDEFMAICTVLFVLVPTIVSVVGDIAGVDLTGISTISVNGDIEGFTIVAFIYSYCLGYFLNRRKEIFAAVSTPLCVLVYILASGLAAALSYTTESVWSYSDLLTVMEAAALILAFSGMNIKSDAVGKIFSKTGGCGLGVFVWHTSPLMLYGFWVHFGIDRITDMSIPGYLLNMLAAVLSMFVVSAVWVLICRECSAGIKKMIGRSSR